MKANRRHSSGRTLWILRKGGSILWLFGLFAPLLAYAQETFNFRVILVREEKEAHQILQRIQAGAPFWKLAIDHSLFPNASLGGYVDGARFEELRKEFRLALQTLAPGETSLPIPVDGGFAILKNESRASSKGAWRKADALFLKAVRLGAQGDFSAAQKKMREVLSFYPNHQPAQFALQLVHRLQQGHVSQTITLQVFEATLLVRKGSPGKALARLERAALEAPQVTELQVALGEIYKMKGDFPKAISAYEKALSSPAWANQANLFLGAVYLQQGNLSKALHHYQSAIAADIGLAQAHSGLGLVYMRLKKPKDALKEFQVVLAIDPHMDIVHDQMGLLLLSQGKIQEAIGAFEKALSIRPDHAPYLSNLGFAYNLLGMFSKALSILERAFALAPKDAMINNNLAVTYYENGQIDKAISYADRAKALGYKLHPDFVAKLAPYRKKRSSKASP